MKSSGLENRIKKKAGRKKAPRKQRPNDSKKLKKGTGEK